MSTITVSTSAALNAAIKTAHAGDTILLKSGTYADIAVKNININGMVTITSADATKPAVLTDLNIDDSSGFTFHHLEVNAVAGVSSKTGVIGVDGSKNIHFDHLDIHGSLNANAADDIPGVRIKLSSDVSVTNSNLHQLFQAVSFGGSDKVTVSGNYVHEIRQDGIRGYDTSNLTIQNNYITNFQKVGTEHADGIQIYSGTIQVAHDIKISGNVITQGAGTEIQGIFIRDPATAIQNVQIQNNLVVGATLNGISVNGANNLSVTGNSVIPRAGETSWLGVKASTNVVASNNTAVQFLLGDEVKTSNNKLTITTSNDDATVRDWLASHTTANEYLPKTTASLAATSIVEDVVSKATSFTLTGTSHDLNLTGSANVDGAGNALDNKLVGNAGDNRLFGYAGNDTLEGGDGDDVMDGGAGIDTASYEHASAGVSVNLLRNGESASGYAQKTFGAGKDTLTDIENLKGSAYADTLSGDDKANVVTGGAGADRLIGNGGGDTLVGGAGGDTFFYYETLDQSTAAAGGRDKIADFNGADGDIISLKLIDANTTVAGDQKFTMVNAFTKVAGQLTSTHEGDHYVVRGDVNGDGVADFAIDVFSTKALTASDFIF